MSAHGSGPRVSLERARSIVCEHAASLDSERIGVEAALGRVLAEPVIARFASPHYRASAMDGIAVRAADTAAASATQPVSLTAADTEQDGKPLHCKPVDTGSALPDWADAVVRIEQVRPTETGFDVSSPVPPGRDVRRIGEDVEAGALILGRGRTLRPVDVGACIATGVARVHVRRRPRFAVIATGSEVIEPLGEGAVAAPGQVIEFNSRVLAAYGAEWGAEVEYLGRAADDEEKLVAAIRRHAAACDALCIIAGSSAGRKAIRVAALRRSGEVLFHGVEVMPGGPAAFALVAARPVFVIPGYPVSAAVVYRELLSPWIDASLGRAHAEPRTLEAVVRRKIASRLGVTELLRVCLASEGDTLVVAPQPRGAGAISTLVRAHGLLRRGPGTEGFAPGDVVEVELLDPAFDPSTVLVAGGPAHELTAALEDVLARRGAPLAISHLGLAPHDALAALAAGEAHLAVVDAGALGDAPASAEIIRLTSRAGASAPCVVLSAALLAGPAITRVRDALATIG
jgi:putative molybdopterin biosynthesis protein